MSFARWIACCVSGAALAAAAGAAQAQTVTVTVAVAAPVTSIDPHYQALSPNESLDANVYDKLVTLDQSEHVIPDLATSWKLVDPTTWEFKLRDAKFQDGSDFTAEDVAYTIKRVPTVKNSPTSFVIFTRSVVSSEIVDPHTIRFHTAAPYPIMPLDMSQVYMISHKLGADPTTEDFNNGKNAIGTGPFRFVSFRPGDRIELERYDGYWGPKPAWQHVSYRIITNDAARLSALLAGDVGLIEAVPTTDLARMRTDPHVRIAETTGARIMFIALDQHSAGAPPDVSGPNGEKLEQNPLKDRRVRLALSLAINRDAIVSRIMEGAATATGQFLPKGFYSYVPDLAPPAFDVKRATELLAEAGFPKGFRITLHGSNDRWVNDGRIVQTIGQMWSRIGVQTNVEATTFPAYIGHAVKGEYPASLLGWGSTGEAPLRAMVGTVDASRGWGPANVGWYSNPAVDALISKELVEMDPAAREKLLQDGTKMAMDDVAIIPLHNQKNIWATRADLIYPARVDEETHVQDLRPAP